MAMLVILFNGISTLLGIFNINLFFFVYMISLVEINFINFMCIIKLVETILIHSFFQHE